MKVKAAKKGPKVEKVIAPPVEPKEIEISMLSSRDFGIRKLIERAMKAVWGPDIDDQFYMFARAVKPHWERWDTVMSKIIEKHSTPMPEQRGMVLFTPVGQMQVQALKNGMGKEKVKLPPPVVIPVELFRVNDTGLGSLDRITLEEMGIIQIVMPPEPAPASAPASDKPAEPATPPAPASEPPKEEKAK